MNSNVTEFWQAGGIPPTTIARGGTLEYWQAGGIPALQATPVVQGVTSGFISSGASVFSPVVTPGAVTVAPGFISSAASVYAPILAVGNPPSTVASHLFPSPLAWWPKEFGR